MIVAHLTPTYFSDDSVVGGGERYVYNVLRAVRAASSSEDSLRQVVVSISTHARSITVDGFPVELLRNESPLEGDMNALSSELWRVLKGVDVVHVHQALTAFGAYAVAVARSMRIPIVATDLGGGADPHMLLGRGLELAEWVVSISRHAQSLVAGEYTGNQAVVIGPVDTETFTPGGPGQRSRGVLCVSRILPHKGIDRIIRALPAGLELRVVGQAYDDAYLRELHRLSDGKNVVFEHQASDEDLLRYYRTSGLFAQGSTHKDYLGRDVSKPELMGLTPMEAMACGAPVLLSDIGPFGEILERAPFGRTFSNDEELAHSLEDFASGAWSPAFEAEHMHQSVEQAFGFRAVGSQLSRVYRAAAGVPEGTVS